ncbi:MAG TPA: cytochrome c [Pyrinomonadaceae bacterium]|nr:cytochrome c [Pyrinomonadaceae bacterium]
MKLFKLAIIAAALSLFFMACADSTNTNQTANTARPTPAPSASPSPTDEFAHARANWAQHCEQCHGANADGGTVKIQDLTLKVPSLKVGHALKHTDEQFARQITKGGDGMPAFAEKLKADEINELVRFIRHEFQSGATSATSNTNSPAAHNANH